MPRSSASQPEVAVVTPGATVPGAFFPVECWRPIAGYEGLYEVSDRGRVQRLREGRDPRVLKPVVDLHGYAQVTLSRGGVGYTCKVAPLVARTFIPNPLGLKTVNHQRSEDKLDNSVGNLEWSSHADQMLHAHQSSLRRRKTVHRRPVVATPVAGGDAVRYESISAAHRAGFDQGLVQRVAKGLRPHYKGYVWSYAD